MKKFSYIFFIIVLFLLFIPNVNAALGDVRYEVTDMNIKGSEITFTGWAFIHKTHNFTSVTDVNGNTVSVKNEYGDITNGDQKILIQAITDNGNIIATKVVEGQSNTPLEYNFYCQMFNKMSGKDRINECVDTAYNGTYFPDWGKTANNKCSLNSIASMCYYEDMGFSISFDTSTWDVPNDTKISFRIAVSNSDFEMRVNKRQYKGKTFNYNGDIFSSPESLFVNEKVVKTSSGNLKDSDNIKIDESTVSNEVAFIADMAIIMNLNNDEYYKADGREFFYGVDDYNKNIYKVYNYNQGTFDYGYSDPKKNSTIGYKLLNGRTYTPGKYAIYGMSNGTAYIIPCNPSNSSCGTYSVWGSWVKPTGGLSFTIIINNDKKCDIDAPNFNLNCKNDDDDVLSSTCEVLTVRAEDGLADVKITQKGHVSTVITPKETYAGSGFSFGIMYYNTIVWDYVGQASTGKLHEEINNIMNSKIKTYNQFYEGLNVTNLKFGKETSIEINFPLYKECFQSSNSNDYYKNELTFACVFYLPESVLLENGDVKYIPTSKGNGIINKYYIPLDYNGSYGIWAKISNMDRVTPNASKNDSVNKGSSWTGNWSGSFDGAIDGCEIQVYPLFYNPAGKYNFIYRPIDIYKPFPPSRNAGINWYDWYNIQRNRDRLENTYSNLQYTAIFNNQTIASIKNYNKNHNYLEWDSIDKNGNSSFIDDYVKREGGTS